MGIGSFLSKAAGLFTKDDGSVTLTRDQAMHVQKLVQKEMQEIDMKRHSIVDNGAKEGKTIPVRTLSRNADSTDPEAVEYMRQQIEELVDKYGEEMPVNTAHRFVRELDGESVWSSNPGCHEIHLLRRDGNRLFTAERRVVTIEEILEAQAADWKLQQEFERKCGEFAEEVAISASSNTPVQRVLAFLQKAEELQEEAAAISGRALEIAETIARLEVSIRGLLAQSAPDVANDLAKTQVLSAVLRIPYLAQFSGAVKSIPDSEFVQALLSEDLEAIARIGSARAVLGNDFRPNDADVKQALDAGVANGFSKRRAGRILAAWSGYDA